MSDERSRKGVRPSIERVESETLMSFSALCRGYARAGYSRLMAADALGLPWGTMREALGDLSEPIAWPGVNEGARARTRYKRVETVLFEGEQITLYEASRRTGIRYRTLLKRRRQGASDEELLRQPHPSQGRSPAVYDLGLSMSDWKVVQSYAAQHGDQVAATKYGIPLGAIRAVFRQEWERLG